MKYDVIIIGAGPAGYVSAIRAGQLGLKTALVEKKHVGGMCLNWGCIPAKSIIESAKMYNKVLSASQFGVDGIDKNKISFNWSKAKIRTDEIVQKLRKGVEFLLKKNGVDLISGEAVINKNNTVSVENRQIEGRHVILATGSYPAPLKLKGLGAKIIELNNLFTLENLPNNIIVAGKGAVSVELAQFFSMIGKKVSFVTPDLNIIPGVDTFLSDYAIKKLKSLHVNIVFSDKLKSFENGLLKTDKGDIAGDIILNCSLRKAIIPKTALELSLNENGYIMTDENFETNLKSVYAIGDVNGKSYLAHVASAQGVWLVNHIKGVSSKFNLNNYPVNIYTYPEMAQIGKTEQDLQKEGREYKLGLFPVSANGKALTEGQNEGLLRLLSDAKYGQVLGVQIIADNATDMIAEAAAYMQIEGSVYDVASTIHAHPTVSEIFFEAALDASDKAIHK